MNDAKPADSGSENQQAAPSEGSSGELMPRPQLKVVAQGVASEAVGLVQFDSETLNNLASHRLLTAHMREQESRIAELRADLGDAAQRERQLRDDNAGLREQLAGTQQALADERKGRTIRALVIGAGALLVPVGVEQWASDRYGLGATLVAIGLVVVLGATLLGSSKRP